MSKGRRPPRTHRPDRQAREAREARPRTVDLWRPVPELEPPEPIERLDEEGVSALVRSLGSPPLPGQAAVAERELAKVVVKAAQHGVALAAVADLLADPPAEPE